MKKIYSLITVSIFVLLSQAYLSAQNVGIGNSNPKAKLDIYGSLKLGSTSSDSASTLNGTIRYGATATEFEGYNGSNWIPLHTLWTKNGSTDIYRPSGKVGIQWASPTGNFGITGDASTDNITLRKTSPGIFLRAYNATASPSTDSTFPFIMAVDKNVNGINYTRIANSTTYPYQFTIHQDGKIGFGTDVPGTRTGISSSLVEFADNDPNHSDWTMWLATSLWNGYPALLFAKSNGTITSPTTVANDWMLGGFQFLGWDGTKFSPAAMIRAEVDSAVASSNVLGRILFFTRQSNKSNPTERMRITRMGLVGINTQFPSEILDVKGRIMIQPTTAPGTTTDRLYNVSGTLYWNGTALSGGGGSGTVTSVGLSLPSGELTVSGSPVTTSGTLSATWANQTTNKVFAAPNGSTGTPTFRALVAADIPNLDWSKITTGLPTTLAGYGITNGVTTSRTINTTAPLAGGGTLAGDLTLSIPAATSSVSGHLTSTDWTTFNNKMTNPMTTAGDIIYGGASGTPTRLAAGTSGQYLQSAGAGAPVWAGLGVVSGLTVLTTASSSPYTVPAGVTTIIVELVGAGGGGAGGVTSGTNAVAGGGGGSGGYVRERISTSPGATFAFSVGSGGSGNSSSNGTAGGNTTFPSLTAGGGGGGTFMAPGTSVTSVNGGTAGTASGGDLNIAGAPGSKGFRNSATLVYSGNGGSCCLGVGGDGTVGQPNLNPTGASGNLYGGGGAGAATYRVSGGPYTATGGSGVNGIIIITEFK